MIRRHIIWRHNHAHDERLRRIVDQANVACAALVTAAPVGEFHTEDIRIRRPGPRPAVLIAVSRHYACRAASRRSWPRALA